MKASLLEGLSFFLMLGICVCVDGLVDTPGGIVALWCGIALSGVLVHLAHLTPRKRTQSRTGAHRTPWSAQTAPLHHKRKKPAKGKRKAAAVVTTPQRHVKQSTQAIISRSHFIEAKGNCQI